MTWYRKCVGTEGVIVEVPEIVGKQRPRFDPRRGSAYMPKKTTDAEAMIRSAWMEQVGGRWADFRGPVEVTVTFKRELAKSNPKFWKGRDDLGKPDLDNALKCVLDALNGIAYRDDAQVVSIWAMKQELSPHGCGNRIFVYVRYYEEIFVEERI